MPVANTRKTFLLFFVVSFFPFFINLKIMFLFIRLRKFSCFFFFVLYFHLGSCFKNGNEKWKIKEKNYIFYYIYKTVTRVNNTTTTTENPLNPLNFHKLFSNFYYFLFLPSWFFLSLYFFLLLFSFYFDGFINCWDIVCKAGRTEQWTLE